MNYQSLTGSHTATVGIQDLDGSNGMKVAFDQAYLENELSLRFTQGPDWISVIPSTGQVEAGTSETLVVEADASNLDDGAYEGYLRLVTSGGNAGLPVSLLVSGNPFIPGDINEDSQVNIQDVILIINFILSVDTPNNNQLIAADINEDGTLNIQDVILIVNSITKLIIIL